MIAKFLSFVCEKVILAPLPSVILFSSLFFFFYVRFFPLSHPVKFIRALKKDASADGISPVKALTLALAGTLGVGNIVGVASAISTGGAGAVFWMTLSSLLSSSLKYSETLLSVKKRITEKGQNLGGPMYYLKSRYLAIFFCIACICANLSVGNLLQSSALSKSLENSLGIPPIISGIALALVCYTIISREIKSAADLCFSLIPLMSFSYILSCIFVILRSHSNIIHLISVIIRDAFSPSALYGGILGFIFSKSVKIGVLRGLVTNESGCGSAPIAHACSECQSGASQGCLGIFEVICDTAISLLTAFVILISYRSFPHLDGMDLVSASFSAYMGRYADYFLSVEICLFASATIIGWSCYGKAALFFITKKKTPTALFGAVSALFIVLGSVFSSSFIFKLADISLALMAYLNIGALIKNRKTIREETDLFISS